MADLAYHRQLQKGLDAITRTTSLLNNKRVALALVEEDLESKKAEVDAMNRDLRNHERDKHTRKAEIDKLEDLKAKKRAEVDAIVATLSHLERLEARERTILVAASNSATEMKEIKELTRREMQLYDTLKQQKLDEYNEAKEDVQAIRNKMNVEAARYNQIKAKSEQEEQTQQERARVLDHKESGLIAKEKYLGIIEKRLMRYAEKLNITL